ncbi:MAG: DUF3623 family protein, partial [Pseudomonadota bacterium]
IGIGFWFSISCCSLFLAAGIYALTMINYSPIAQTQIVMLMTLVCLALLEHLFMIMPFSESRLWRWAMPRKEKPVVGNHDDKKQITAHQN